MRIRIINGSYGLHDGRRVVTMTARSGAFEAEDAEARALISAGVAASAESGERSSEMSAAPVARVLENSRQSQEEVAHGATGSSGAAVGGPSADGEIEPPAADGGQSGDRSSESGDDSGFRTTDSDLSSVAPVAADENSEIPGESAETVDYLTLSAAELREICDERGIPYRKNAGVKALAALLAADDERPLPELTADAESDIDGIMPALFAADPVD